MNSTPQLWLRNTGQLYLIYGNEIVWTTPYVSVVQPPRWEYLALAHPKLNNTVTVEAVRIA